MSPQLCRACGARDAEIARLRSIIASQDRCLIQLQRAEAEQVERLQGMLALFNGGAS